MTVLCSQPYSFYFEIVISLNNSNWSLIHSITQGELELWSSCLSLLSDGPVPAAARSLSQEALLCLLRYLAVSLTIP